MRKEPVLCLLLICAGLCSETARAVAHDCLDIVLCGDGSGDVANWVLSAKSEGGIWQEQGGSWVLETTARDDNGRIVLSLDRDKLSDDIGMSLICDGDESADVALQLLNDKGEVVVVDLVGNAIALQHDEGVRTFSIPLRKHPSATRVAIQQLSGKVSVRGIVLCPLLIGDGNETDLLTQIEVLKLLRQQLSSSSPAWHKIEQIMQEKHDASSSSAAPNPAPYVPTLNASDASSQASDDGEQPSQPTTDTRAYFDFTNRTFCGVQLGRRIEDVIEAYGKDAFPTYAREVIAELPYAGSYRDRYDYRYRTDYTVIHTIGGKVANLFCWSPHLRTDRGLVRGDSRERLIKLYGNPESTFNNGKALNYYFNDIRAVVFLGAENNISHIEVLKTVEDAKMPAE